MIQSIQSGLITDSKGEISVSGLPYGLYTFTEIKTPKDYALDSNPYMFTINDSTE